MEEINEKRFYFECSCGCGVLQFSQWKDDGVAFIRYLIPAFTSSQEGRLSRIKKGLKAFWNIVILDKEYCLYEIVIEDNNKLKELKEFVGSMTEIAR